jgi:metallophosphoesterase (TIGR00282 family)
MNIIFIGDIFGRPGRDALRKAMPEIRRRHEPDFIIANGENSAGGKGINAAIVQELLDLGVDCITGGNHSFYVRGSEAVHDDEHRLLRPANFPPGTPGRGMGVYTSEAGFPVAVINACGRTFMQQYDDPWRLLSSLVEQARRQTPLVIVDFHAEATSEMQSMGRYLDGRVSAVLGTHTHVPTADECIFPEGTAFQCDVGMTGPHDSILGRRVDRVLAATLTGMPHPFDVAEKDLRINGALVTIDAETGRATAIERVLVIEAEAERLRKLKQ